MFVTCHINFWPLSNFVGASLEVTRTISNNKLHFTWGCSILLLKKRKRALRPDSFDHSDIFLNILFVIITSLAIYYSQNVSRSYSILVCIGVQVFFSWFYFSLLLLSVIRSRARLALASVWPKNAEKLRLFGRSRPPEWN